MTTFGACHKCGNVPGGCHWCVLPESLKPVSKRKRKPCDLCGRLTPGTHATVQRLQMDGSLVDPPHLCAECDGGSAVRRKQQAYSYERAAESRAAGRRNGG